MYATHGCGIDEYQTSLPLSLNSAFLKFNFLMMTMAKLIALKNLECDASRVTSYESMIDMMLGLEASAEC